MPAPDQSIPAGGSQSFAFTTTHWSLVLAAGEAGGPGSEQALERLCGSYWYPLYAFIRRQGNDEETAKDLTQGFFARVLEKQYLTQVQREKGRFRSFLLASLKHFLADEWDKSQAQKRGGGVNHISLDETCEDRYRMEPADPMNAEHLFERRWALTLLAQARERLRTEFVAAGKTAWYERLECLESGDQQGLTYAMVGAEFDLSESGVKSAVSRLRKRYAELVREEVAHTVSHPDEVDEEIRHLINVIAG